jgi:hypothetical protein
LALAFVLSAELQAAAERLSAAPARIVSRVLLLMFSPGSKALVV